MASDQAILSRPVSTVDPFSHEFLRDPYPNHEALREAGLVSAERRGTTICYSLAPDQLAQLAARLGGMAATVQSRIG